MAYQYVRTAAYVPDPAQGRFPVLRHTLSLPAHWEEPLGRLRDHGRMEGRWHGPRRIPTREINQLIRTTAPDVVTIASNATFGTDAPWLYCTEPLPAPVTNLYAATWLRSLPRDPEDPAPRRLLTECFHDLDTGKLTWRADTVDLLEQQLSSGGTAMPARQVYRLLPDELAARIARQGAYEHGGRRLTFHQVAGVSGGYDAGSSSAELMSWPPIEHRPAGRSGERRPSYYAATLRVSVRTVPFSPVPRVHLSAGIRRFVTGKVWMPSRKGVSVYLLPEVSLVPDGPVSRRLSVAMLQWRNGTTDWRQGGPGGMLAAVAALDGLPSVDRLVKEADHWIGNGRDGIGLAVGHQTAMGRHPIGTGLMPSERRRLIEWAEQALAPEFVPAPKLERSRYGRPPARHLAKRPAMPKDATGEELAAVLERTEQTAAENARVRRAALASTLDGADLVVVLLHQTDDQRDRLVATAESGLGLKECRREQGPETWVWETEELTVRLHAHQLGVLGSPLGTEDRPPRAGQEHDQAIRERRGQVAEAMTRLRTQVPGARIALVELEGSEAFQGPRRRTDPKYAIRLGCADAGLVTQFIRPLDTGTDAGDAEKDAAMRAEAAWADGLRQTGMRLVPRHTLGDRIPPGLNQVAFHLVERRIDGPTGKAQFTPIAVLLRPDAPCVLGRTADTPEWMPYPDLLRTLTGRVRGSDLRTSAQQSAVTAAFIRRTLASLRGAPTLVLAHAQDVRKRWPWLTNGGLELDRIGLDGGPTQRIGLYGRHLRIVRVADGGRDETPQWWAEREEREAELAGQQRGGFGMGLWVSRGPGGPGRVFYSTADKASTQTKLTNDDAKLTPHVNPAGRNAHRPTANAWNPELLELTLACLQPGDDPEAWAALVHQQRICKDDYRDVLGLPLVLHLARLADEYALPHDEEEAVDPTAGPVEGTDEPRGSGQLAFDFENDEHDEDQTHEDA
ncbi:pPIWI_RE module domain-containing protein [Streptomyces roseolilacinus]|uniref:pPIWI_RE module domain-containing protein n=1 Tax=Streptomyces roseolilacinus TaxID=66904 RepID=UPI00380C7FCB